MVLWYFWLEIAAQYVARRECCVFRACYSAASPAEWNTQRLHRSAILQHAIQDHISKCLWIPPVAPSFSGKPLLKLIHAHTSLARTGYTFPQQAGFSKPSTVVAKILCFLSMRVGSSLAKRFVHVKGGETSKFERCWAPPSDGSCWAPAFPPYEYEFAASRFHVTLPRTFK